MPTPSVRVRISLAALALTLPAAAGHAQVMGAPTAARASVTTDRARAAVGVRVVWAIAPATRPRIAGQIVGSALGAAALGFGAWYLLDDPEGSDRRVKGDAGYTPNANTAYAVGSLVGATVVAYLIGRGDGSRGSLAATALGAAIPSVPLFFGRHEPYLPIIGIVLGAPLQGIGATIGYQRSR